MKTTHLAPTDRAANLRSGVRNALRDGEPDQARRYVAFAKEQQTVEASVIHELEREIAEAR